MAGFLMLQIEKMTPEIKLKKCQSVLTSLEILLIGWPNSQKCSLYSSIASFVILGQQSYTSERGELNGPSRSQRPKYIIGVRAFDLTSSCCRVTLSLLALLRHFDLSEELGSRYERSHFSKIR